MWTSFDMVFEHAKFRNNKLEIFFSELETTEPDLPPPKSGFAPKIFFYARGCQMTQSTFAEKITKNWLVRSSNWSEIAKSLFFLRFLYYFLIYLVLSDTYAPHLHFEP